MMSALSMSDVCLVYLGHMPYSFILCIYILSYVYLYMMSALSMSDVCLVYLGHMPYSFILCNTYYLMLAENDRKMTRE